MKLPTRQKFVVVLCVMVVGCLATCVYLHFSGITGGKLAFAVAVIAAFIGAGIDTAEWPFHRPFRDELPVVIFVETPVVSAVAAWARDKKTRQAVRAHTRSSVVVATPKAAVVSTSVVVVQEVAS